MLRLYSGLLLLGLSAAAHATEGGDVSIFQSDQSAIRSAHSSAHTDADFLSPYGLNGSRAAFIRTADVAPAGSGFGTVSEQTIVSRSEKEASRATAARWNGKDGGDSIVSLLRHKRVEYSGDQFKITLRQDSASIESGNVKVALRSGSTSMFWSKPL